MVIGIDAGGSASGRSEECERADPVNPADTTYKPGSRHGNVLPHYSRRQVHPIVREDGQGRHDDNGTGTMGRHRTAVRRRRSCLGDRREVQRIAHHNIELGEGSTLDARRCWRRPHRSNPTGSGRALRGSNDGRGRELTGYWLPSRLRPLSRGTELDGSRLACCTRTLCVFSNERRQLCRGPLRFVAWRTGLRWWRRRANDALMA